MKTKIAIVGSRSHPNPKKAVYELMEERVLSTPTEQLVAPTVIISGGARGVDYEAEMYGMEHGLQVISFRPWGKTAPFTIAKFTFEGQTYKGAIKDLDQRSFGSFRDAAMARNELIVEEAEEIYALWDGKSPGTRNTIMTAMRAKKPIWIRFP